jgi:hypothetical protein
VFRLTSILHFIKFCIHVLLNIIVKIKKNHIHGYNLNPEDKVPPKHLVSSTGLHDAISKIVISHCRKQLKVTGIYINIRSDVYFSKKNHKHVLSER